MNKGDDLEAELGAVVRGGIVRKAWSKRLFTSSKDLDAVLFEKEGVFINEGDDSTTHAHVNLRTGKRLSSTRDGNSAKYRNIFFLGRSIFEADGVLYSIQSVEIDGEPKKVVVAGVETSAYEPKERELVCWRGLEDEIWRLPKDETVFSRGYQGPGGTVLLSQGNSLVECRNLASGEQLWKVGRWEYDIKGFVSDEENLYFWDKHDQKLKKLGLKGEEIEWQVKVNSDEPIWTIYQTKDLLIIFNKKQNLLQAHRKITGRVAWKLQDDDPIEKILELTDDYIALGRMSGLDVRTTKMEQALLVPDFICRHAHLTHPAFLYGMTFDEERNGVYIANLRNGQFEFVTNVPHRVSSPLAPNVCYDISDVGVLTRYEINANKLLSEVGING